MSGWRVLTSTCAHYPAANGTASFDVGAQCLTKTDAGIFLRNEHSREGSRRTQFRSDADLY